MKTFEAKRAGIIIYNLTEVIQQNKSYLSEIDGATGDGDHGVNMNKGFTMCRAKLEDAGDIDAIGFADAAEILGNTLLSEIGGSMGPLYGMFFLEIADNIRGKDYIGAEDFLAMLKAGLAGITSLVPTKLGDKTLLDVLVPSVDVFESALAGKKPQNGEGADGSDGDGGVGGVEGLDDYGGVDGVDGVGGEVFQQALAAMTEAARTAREATKDMVAKVGRASTLGERSRGFYDAGATSCALILASMADSALALLT